MLSADGGGRELVGAGISVPASEEP